MSDSTTTQDSNLTADHVKALRSAVADKSNGRRYSLSVRYDKSTNVANVVIVRENDLGEDSEPRFAWQRTELPALGRISSYNKRDRYGLVLVASDAHYTSDTFSALRSLATFAKPGDQLMVVFQLANNTETLEKAGLDHDTARIVIIRKGKFVGDIYVADVIAPYSSSALYGNV